MVRVSISMTITLALILMTKLIVLIKDYDDDLVYDTDDDIDNVDEL